MSRRGIRRVIGLHDEAPRSPVVYIPKGRPGDETEDDLNPLMKNVVRESDETVWENALCLLLTIFVFGLWPLLYYNQESLIRMMGTDPEISPETTPETSLDKVDQSLLGPIKLNFTQEMEPFWRNYRDILTNLDYDSYFDDVNASSDAIDFLFDRKHPVIAFEAGLEHEWGATKNSINFRRQWLERAHASWDTFLAHRAKMLDNLIGAGSFWQVDGALIKQTTQMNGAGYQPSWTFTDSGLQPNNASQKGLAQDGDVYVAASESARRLTAELIRIHHNLFQPNIDGIDQALYVNLAQAQHLEKSFLPNLLARTAAPKAWNNTHKDSMDSLRKRLGHVRDQHGAMRDALKWLEEHFGGNLEKSIEAGEDLSEWAQMAQELMKSHSTVLLDVQEGVLFKLRRNELKGKDLEKIDYGQDWKAWKQRNCGSSICYDAKDTWGTMKSWVVPGKPLAGVARDEVKMRKGASHMVIPRVYDTACCKESKLEQLLKHGMKPVYHP
ncbi:hypothetical protein F5Y15DRAFT_391156 [Xylariaceae sp. FL0016]|nr:hypothetical protein F5Y15DRAFT_391156 [Xylariaceae sp. FL0016]